MSAGKAHPYLVSFLKVGFVAQDAAGRYELGPLALQLGLAKLQRLDPVKEASPLIEALAAETEQSVAVAVWGNFGPTIVRLEEPIQPLHVNLRTGTVMSLAYTATGRLFAAYMPPKVVEKIIMEDVARQSGRAGGTMQLTRAQMDDAIIETRCRACRAPSANRFPASMRSVRRSSTPRATSCWASPRWVPRPRSTTNGMAR